MKKQAVEFTLLNILLSTSISKIMNTITNVMLLTMAVLFSLNAHAKQNVLLDANGIPLTDEVLLLLSSGTEKFDQRNQTKKPISNSSKKSSTDETKLESSKSNIKLIKRPKRQSNPLLEEEMLDAMKAGKVQRVKQLLRAGVAPTFKNYKGETPLGIAVSRGWASMVISLIENGADINEKGARGVTLLHVASAKGLTDVAKVLVRGGLSPSKKTDKNWTPLHVAARYNHWQLVQYYVSEGVDPDIRNSDGQTALGLARHLRHQGIIKILSRVTRRSSLDFAEMNLLKKKSKKKRKKRKSKK